MRLVNKENGKNPVYSTEESAGADLFCNKDVVIHPFDRVLVSTGCYVELDDNDKGKLYKIEICSKSGLAYKHGIIIVNSPGTVDQDYKDEIKVIVSNISNETFVFEKGDKVAQAILVPVEKFSNLETVNKKRNGGFGSTGK